MNQVYRVVQVHRDRYLVRNEEKELYSAERWKMFSRLEKENQWSKIRKNEKMMNIAVERRKRNMALQRHGRGTDRG